MTTKPTGGPAYPQHLAISPEGDIYGSDDFEDCAGLTVRDAFAIAALARIPVRDSHTFRTDAIEAYAMADAMIEVRDE